MNAAETIQAAIERLTKLKADSAPGTWQHWPEAGDIEIFSDHVEEFGSEFVVVSRVRPRLGWGKRIYETNYEPTAELIVTLHRTIDAQLAILHEAKYICHHWFTVEYEPEFDSKGPQSVWYLAAVDLARAILGGDQ